jgi:hypothetical protein
MDSELKGYAKTKDSRDEIHETYSRIQFVRSYEGVSKSFRTSCLERELQTVQLSATRCSCIAILWVILVSFAAITLYVAGLNSQAV